MTSASNKPRYAVYFAPNQDSLLAEFGRDVLSDTPLRNDHPARISVTRTAAHYGFHATIKAPMELKEGVEEDQLLEAVASFCLNQKSIVLNSLAPRTMKGFHALTLEDSPSVNTLAENVVKHFEPFRAPLSASDRARRNPDALSETQRKFLDNFGYPFVLSEFRFHMTLSNRMEMPEESASYHQWLTKRYSKTVTETPVLDQLAVFRQDNRAVAFTRLAEFPVK